MADRLLANPLYYIVPAGACQKCVEWLVKLITGSNPELGPRLRDAAPLRRPVPTHGRLAW